MLDIPRMCQIGLSDAFTYSLIPVFMYSSDVYQALINVHPNLTLTFLDLRPPPPLPLQTLALTVFPTSSLPMPNVNDAHPKP